MNSDQAKKIDFPDLLSRLGFEPVKVRKGGRELWYCSPFRQEKEPSFHTSFLGGKWIWNDFGDTGGNVIDFVMRYESVQFKEALAYLRNMYQGSKPSSRAGHSFQKSSLSSFQQQGKSNASAPQRELEFLKAHAIKNPVILTYLEEQRKIPADLARLYLEEVHYRNIPKDKTFFAFGMKNESGGYEIRSASDQYKFKSALIKRDITIIRGRESQTQSVRLFEGMTDFLSLLALQNANRLEGDAIIMHSLSSFQRTVEKVRSFGYTRINTFLDNNNPGQEHTEKFKAEFPDRVTSWSDSFLPHTDLNDALKGGAVFSFSPDTKTPNP